MTELVFAVSLAVIAASPVVVAAMLLWSRRAPLSPPRPADFAGAKERWERGVREWRRRNPERAAELDREIMQLQSDCPRLRR